MIHERYYAEVKKQEELILKKNNGGTYIKFMVSYVKR